MAAILASLVGQAGQKHVEATKVELAGLAQQRTRAAEAEQQALDVKMQPEAAVEDANQLRYQVASCLLSGMQLIH
ncbi:hypothetical protein WJX72_004553 [[Myrmecia] bisecta]|uniref:Uncharacterized protein n=1 Tax=[Myrmecia] bisecta TaxID=41462 RepID=A0AAW1QRB5_9CHLO